MASQNISPKLIISADDFGLTSAVNEEIIRCIEEGIATSTSLIACGRAADEAIKLFKNITKNIGLGIHLTLDSEYPVANPSSIPTIVSKKGVFLNRSQIILRLFCGQIKIEDIHREWSAQIKKVINAGLLPDHLDSHGHIHIFPTLLSIVIDIAKHFGIPAIRLPIVPWRSRRLLSLISLNLAAHYASTKFKSVLRHPDVMLGFSFGGCYSESTFLKDISLIKNPDIAEAVFHPGPENIDVPVYNSWGYSWAIDSATLRSNSVKDYITEKGINLITFKDLP